MQALIPLGLKAVEEMLTAETDGFGRCALCPRTRGLADCALGQQAGSIYLADQKLPITVPRVRDRVANRELPLPTYEQLQTPRAQDVGL